MGHAGVYDLYAEPIQARVSIKTASDRIYAHKNETHTNRCTTHTSTHSLHLTRNLTMILHCGNGKQTKLLLATLVLSRHAQEPWNHTHAHSKKQTHAHRKNTRAHRNITYTRIGIECNAGSMCVRVVIIYHLYFYGLGVGGCA